LLTKFGNDLIIFYKYWLLITLKILCVCAVVASLNNVGIYGSESWPLAMGWREGGSKWAGGVGPLGGERLREFEMV
jgi:hypothetical protein